MSKLNEIDQGQLTYRTNNSTLSTHLTNHGAFSNQLANYSAFPAQTANHNVSPTHMTNQISASIPHSHSSPLISQKGSHIATDLDLFNYLDTIDLLHKRHLEEKKLIAGVRQKI